MLTSVLVAAVSSLTTVSVVLLVLLIRRRAGARPATPEPALARDVSQLALDLQRALERFRPHEARDDVFGALETWGATSSEGDTERARAAPARDDGKLAEIPPADDLDHLLERTLRAARAVEGVDAALVLLTGHAEPIVGTDGLDSWEADRLAGNLPAVIGRRRSIEISFDYGTAPRGVGAARLASGLAVPLPAETPGLLAVFSRSPDTVFRDDHVGMLEQVVERASPAYEAVARARSKPPPHRVDMAAEGDPPPRRGAASSHRHS